MCANRCQVSAWIVPVRFWRMQSIGDRHYFSQNKVGEIQIRTQPRKNNVSFMQMSSSGSASELKEYRMIAIEAMQNIDLGEEFYIDYGSEYSSSWSQTQ